MKGFIRKRLNVGVCALSLLLSFTPAEIALANGQQHDAHVQTWLASRPQHDAHVQAWLRTQATKPQQDAHVQAWLKAQVAPQQDAHVQAWLASRPQHDAHVQTWLKEQASKPQHDAHVQAWLKAQAETAPQHDAHVQTWRNYQEDKIVGDCSEFTDLTIDGKNVRTITLASIASNLSADCSEYLTSNHQMYCQCQFDKASSKPNNRDSKMTPEDLRMITRQLMSYHSEQVVAEKFDKVMKDYLGVSKKLLFALSDPNLSESVNTSEKSCTPNGIKDFFDNMTSLGPKVCTNNALSRLAKLRKDAHFKAYESCLGAAASSQHEKLVCDRKFNLDSKKLEEHKAEKNFVGPTRPNQENFGDSASKGALRHYHQNYVSRIEDLYNQTYPDKKVDLAKLNFDEMNKELIRIKEELSDDPSVQSITILKERKFYGQNLQEGQESFANSLFAAYMLWQENKQEQEKTKYMMALGEIALVLGDNPLFSKFRDDKGKMLVEELFGELKHNMERVKSVSGDMPDAEAMARSLLLIQEEEVQVSEIMCNALKREMIGICAAEQNSCIGVADLKIPQNIEHIEAYLRDNRFNFESDPDSNKLTTVLGQLSCVATTGDSYAGIKRNDIIATILNGEKMPNTYSILDQNLACSKEQTDEAIINSGLVDPELIGPTMPNKNSAFHRELAGAYKNLESSDFSPEIVKNYFNKDSDNKSKKNSGIIAYSGSDTTETAKASGQNFSKTLGGPAGSMAFDSNAITAARAVSATGVVGDDAVKNSPLRNSITTRKTDDQERVRYETELDELKKERALFNKDREDHTKSRITELERKIQELKDREERVATRNTSDEKALKAEPKPTPTGGQIPSFSSLPTSKERTAAIPTPAASGTTAGDSDSATGPTVGRSPASITENRGNNLGPRATDTNGNDGQGGAVLTSLSAPIFLEARDIKEVKSEDLQKFVTDANKNGVISVILADKKTYLIPVKDGKILIAEAIVQSENLADVQNKTEQIDEKQLEEMASLHPELICTLYPSLGREIPEGIKCDNIAK